MAIETAFDGANSGYRLARKGLLAGSADTLAARELKLLWNRSHHLCRNNAAASTAQARLVAHWIGKGITVRWSSPVMQKAWDAFIKNPSVDGYGSLANMESLWGYSYFESGEVFSRMLIQRRDDCPIPLKLQVLEAEQLDPQYFAPGNIRYGIKFDDFGKPLEYHFWNRHPNEYSYEKVLKRVPISSNDILHIFSRERPGQWRGIPKLAAAMLPIYEMDELTDAALVRQKAAQAVGWIIKKLNAGGLPSLGDVEDTTDPETGASKKIQKILPGGVHYLQPDEDFEFAAVDDIGANFVPLLEHEWRMIASCLDVTYEQLTGDLTNVNFSSIRAGLIEFRRRVAMTQSLIFINRGLLPLTERFKQLASLYISEAAGNATCKFTLPKTEWVDPLKDAQADIAEIRAGLATLQDKLTERGVEDIDTHIKQLATEQGFEIVLDSNPKHNTQDKTQVSDPQTETLPTKKGAKNVPA